MKHIPNFITSLNLILGFFAIIFASSGDIVTSSWLILAAMIFDFLDGFSARLFKAYSAIGKELDSLADVISFGVAPGLIIYQLLRNSLSLNAPVNADLNSVNTLLLILISALMPVCGALRLAMFNIDTTQTKTFKGLPIPANALAVISVVIAGHNSQSHLFNTFSGSPFLLILFTVVLSLLMVSRIPLLSMKAVNLKLKGNEGRYILIILVLAAFAIFRINAFPLVIPLYIIASALSLFF
jgi:CDP-diacylglycerol--serine O-phosphatidyltransferase